MSPAKFIPNLFAPGPCGLAEEHAVGQLALGTLLTDSCTSDMALSGLYAWNANAHNS